MKINIKIGTRETLFERRILLRFDIIKPCPFEWLLDKGMDREIYRVIKQEIIG